jgi:adenylosuccinate lyase
MINRYALPQMTALWSLSHKYKTWLQVEQAVANAQASLGLIPEKDAKVIGAHSAINPQRIEEIETEVRHDFIAFTTHISEQLEGAGKSLHYGLTSSDVIDTSLSITLRQALMIIAKDLDMLIATLISRAEEFKTTLCMGRSHGVHGEPTTFGLKLLGFASEFARHKERIMQAYDTVSVCTFSGAMGTAAHMPLDVEAAAAKALGLKAEPIATQIIPRDRHAEVAAVLALVAGGVERLSTEVRHLQRSEVREVEEGFAKGQKGSSAMPHKKNPILTENLSGLARMVRSYAMPMMESACLWHERDMSHSSVERFVWPDAFCTLDFALMRLNGVMENLVVHPENMQKNIDLLGGLHNAQSVMLMLTQEKSMSREDAYKAVQAHAMSVWNEGGKLKDKLLEDSALNLSEKDLAPCFDDTKHSRHVEALFERTKAAIEIPNRSAACA